MRVAMDYPAPIRSWASDILGAFDPDYVWHDLAQVWQTPQVGEQAVAQMISMPANALAQRYESLGMTARFGRGRFNQIGGCRTNLPAQREALH